VTISILAIDEKTGRMGGVAATGSLCVGGWVLRGNAESGMSASQGTAPSTLWGDGVLRTMADGIPAAEAVASVTSHDPGRAHRQLAALDPTGGTGAFTGPESVAFAGSDEAPGLVVAGNMLTGAEVLDAAIAGYRSSTQHPFAERLLTALSAAAAAGGDSRGLLSAALLIVGRDIAPLTLRIDHATQPLEALADLYRIAMADPYHGWTQVVPVLDDPFRTPLPEDVSKPHDPIADKVPAARR
jgi:uncharacterized Ntn-hydrolase superfamily protein